jgi:hypothetical protein
MTVKEKAKELVGRFDYNIYGWEDDNQKECALICINEILKGSRLFYIEDYDYWNKVKQEINKL